MRQVDNLKSKTGNGVAVPVCRSFLRCLCLFAAQSVLAGGVTLITHGFNSDVASWIIPMQDRIAHYGPLSPTNTACYQISVTQSGGQFVTTATFLSGTNPLAAAAGEILIKLDWSTLSTTFGVSTIDIATAAAAALRSTNLISELNGHALAELATHLIGHSRGASVVSEMARLLGAQGIWVDQVTTLDPVPVGLYGDPTMKNYSNVLYTDNYWQNIGSPSGQALAGAYNRRLTNLSGGYASSDHSDVHLWYHGTVDFTTTLTVDGATINNTERQNWWMPLEQRGTNAGLRLSLIGGGDRLSSVEPAGAGNGRISDGFNQNYPLGGGPTTNRVTLPINQGAWPNPILLRHTATNPMPAGASFDFTLLHQSGTNTATNINMQIYLDRDGNPWNGNESLLYQEVIAGTGTNMVASVIRTPQPDAMAAAPGTYRLLTKMSANGRARFLYAPTLVNLTPSLAPPSLAALGVTNGVFKLRVSGLTGQIVVTEASTNLTQWTAIATNTMAGTSFDLLDSQAAGTPVRFFRAKLQP